jgi:hypothetical protein
MPHQLFVNDSAKQFIKTDEAVIEFCILLKSSGTIGRFVGMDKLSALNNIINPLLERGRLSLVVLVVISRQTYVAANAGNTMYTLFIASIKKDFAERYAGRTFTADEVSSDFKVTIACAYRYIRRHSKVGFITVKHSGKGCACTVAKMPQATNGNYNPPPSVLFEIAEFYKGRNFTCADLCRDFGILPAAAHHRLRRMLKAGLLRA